MDIQGYSRHYRNDERLLNEHGFEQWPTDEELTRYLFNINDKIDALLGALNLVAFQDVRGRWIIDQAHNRAM